MNFLDIILLSIVVFFLIRGAIRDVSQQLFSLITLFISLLIGARIFPWVIIQLPIANSPGFARSVWAFVTIFLLLAIILNFISWLLQIFLSRLSPNMEVKVASAFIGMVKGILINCIILFILAVSNPKSVQLSNSRIFSYFRPGVECIFQLFPPPFRFNYEEKSKEIMKYQRLKPPKIRV